MLSNIANTVNKHTMTMAGINPQKLKEAQKIASRFLEIRPKNFLLVMLDRKIFRPVFPENSTRNIQVCSIDL